MLAALPRLSRDPSALVLPGSAASPPRASYGAFWIAMALAAAVVLLYAGFGAVTRSQEARAVARAVTGGDPDRAPALLRRYGCSGCHSIGGVAGADGQVGGPLDGLRRRVYIAGVVPNAPQALVAWIVSPTSFSPRTAMPPTGITEAEARDVAAFLYTR